MNKLVFENIAIEAGNKKILKNVNLTIEKGDVLALVGPNGQGKSTLLNALMGNTEYKITEGHIYLDDIDITNLSPDEKSRLGIFMAFQNPPEIEGVPSMDFFKLAINAHREKPISFFEYYKMLEKGYQDVNLDSSMKERSLNLNFSGGEKKRNEILQMNLLKPEIALLDEIDSGLDIDAFKLIAENILRMKEENGTTFVVVSHYDKLYKMLKPNKTAVVMNGTIPVVSDGSLAINIAEYGYSYFEKEYNIKLQKKDDAPIALATCAVKKTK